MYSVNLILKNRYIVYNRVLGSGISKIFLGKDIEHGEMVAIKQIAIRTNSNIKKEIFLLENIDHPNIVKLLDYHYLKEYAYLVFEYCEGGDLYNYEGYKSESDIRNIYIQISKGLLYLRSKKIYHHDVKPHNILIKKNVLKICDFGFANNFELICGSPIYMAPELFSLKKYSAKSDIWSFGIILYEMLSNSLPYGLKSCKSIKDISASFQNELVFKDILSEASQDLLRRMLEVDYSKRLNWNELLDNDWINADKLSNRQLELKPNGYLLNVPLYDNYFSVDDAFALPEPSTPISIYKSNSDKSSNRFKYNFIGTV